MRTLLVASSLLLGFFGVALGAFGAHAIKAEVTPQMLEVWKTAVSYQMYHSIFLFALAVLAYPRGGRLITSACLCLLAGVVVFSGSLYCLVWFNMPRLGMVTPIGGSLLLLAWLLALITAVKQKIPSPN